jgi:polyvinyl alcohol dehydrogenase (cytochrome)
MTDMTSTGRRACLVLGCISLILGGDRAARAEPAPTSASALYQQHCALCHEASATTHAPTRAALKELAPETIMRALDAGGRMEQPGQSLDLPERRALAEFLTGKPFGGGFKLSAAAFCSDAAAFKGSFADPHWNGWGNGAANWRFQPAAAAGLSSGELAHLKLRWAFAFPNVSSMRSQPAVLGGRLFIGSGSGTVYSLDARSGCIYWTFDAGASVRTAMEIADAAPGGRPALYFGDMQAHVYALDAGTGQLIWKVRIEDRPAAGITGALKVFQGMVLVPLMGSDDTPAADAKFECCKASGALIALDAATGARRWRTDTTAAAHRTGTNSAGTPTWGPSGASIWSSPTLDPKRNAIYVTTGDNHSRPATDTSDAILALDAASGRILWSRQFTQNDAFNLGCVVADRANCPEQPGADFDFGSSAVLLELAAGKRLLIAGQKSGMVHALDPDHEGAVVWETRAAVGGILGGVEWGIASDGDKVYVPVSDFALVLRPSSKPGMVFDAGTNPAQGGGLIALDAATGRPIWSAPPIPCPRGREACSPAQLAPATAIPGAVFSGSMSGYIRAYSAEDGRVLWAYDTERSYQGVDGVPGVGGALDEAGAVIANGMLFVTSGWDSMAVHPGNVLLAFGLDPAPQAAAE